MEKFLALRLAGLCYLFFTLTACSQSQENSLLSDQKGDPSAHALDKTPKAEELYVKTYIGSIAVASGVTKAEVSGECYVSTFPSHKILALENGNILQILDINPTTDVNASYASCKNGKFNLAINTGVLASGSHTIRFVMQAYDNSNKLFTNDVQGVSTLTLTK